MSPRFKVPHCLFVCRLFRSVQAVQQPTFVTSLLRRATTSGYFSAMLLPSLGSTERSYNSIACFRRRFRWSFHLPSRIDRSAAGALDFQKSGLLRSRSAPNQMSEISSPSSWLGQFLNAGDRTERRQPVDERADVFGINAPGCTCPGQRMMNGTRVPPSYCVVFAAAELAGVTEHVVRVLSCALACQDDRRGAVVAGKDHDRVVPQAKFVNASSTLARHSDRSDKRRPGTAASTRRDRRRFADTRRTCAAWSARSLFD